MLIVLAALRYRCASVATAGNSLGNLMIIGLANTMDLAQKYLPAVTSRVGTRRLPFMAYKFDQVRAKLHTHHETN
jgi:Cdc6-like AAA superfamily ATPase